MTLMSIVEPPVTALLGELLADPVLSKAVTYRRWVSQSFDRALGHVVEAYSDVILTALELRHTRESIKSSSAEVSIGDKLFVFRHGDLPSGYSQRDVIVESGKQHRIKGIDEIFSIATAISVDTE